jgi:6-pyruvoyltetrahydropterin/6-carboxytetrahydropterin synthase
MPHRSAKSRPNRARNAERAEPGLVYLTREVHFCAAHRLRNPKHNGKWNLSKFGHCANLHGHNYTLEATVCGAPDPDTGFVIALADLKDVLYRAVVQPCDHCSLEDDVPFLKGVIPSTENMAISFWGQIEKRLKGCRLHAVRLYESPRNFAEYFGP